MDLSRLFEQGLRWRVVLVTMVVLFACAADPIPSRSLNAVVIAVMFWLLGMAIFWHPGKNRDDGA